MTHPATAAWTHDPQPPEALLRRPNRPNVSHLLAGELRRVIVRGEMAVGDILPSEGQLARTLGVSRDTLREALRMLERESLVAIRRGRNGGAVVRRPDRRAVRHYVALLLEVRDATIDDIHEARATLELPAIRLLADGASDAGAAGVRALGRALPGEDADPYSGIVGTKDFDHAVDTAATQIDHSSPTSWRAPAKKG